MPFVMPSRLNPLVYGALLLIGCGAEVVVVDRASDPPDDTKTTAAATSGSGASGSGPSGNGSTGSGSFGGAGAGDKLPPPDDPNDPCDVTDAGCGGGNYPVDVYSAAPEGALLLQVVGTYEVHSDHSFSCSPIGNFFLTVNKPGHHVLVLSSYEYAFWMVEAGPGVTIEHVIIDGYSEAFWSVPVGTVVEEHTYIGTGSSITGGTYTWPSGDATKLVNFAQDKTGAQLDTFYGQYCMHSLVIE